MSLIRLLVVACYKVVTSFYEVLLVLFLNISLGNGPNTIFHHFDQLLRHHFPNGIDPNAFDPFTGFSWGFIEFCMLLPSFTGFYVLLR